MASNKYKILIIEDEANIRNFVRTILETSEYHVIEAQNQGEGKIMFRSHVPDLVILDLGLPDANGIEFIKAVRLDSSIPILVLSARTDESDKVEALDCGANDYITKPFGSAELVARVRAALRIHYQNMNKGLEESRHFCVGNLDISYEQRKVTIGGEEIRLTPTEYNIVALLSSHAGRVMTYAEIIREIWMWNDPGSVKKLQVNMANIRKKMGAKPGQYQYILNELGVGYRMNTDEE